MEPGIYYDMPEADYFAIEAFNFTGSKELDKSPAHYLTYRERIEETTTQREAFKATHIALLQPHLYKDKVVVVQGGNSKFAKEEKQLAKESGKITISQERSDIIEVLKGTFTKNTEIQKIMCDAQTEVVVVWIDEKTGCKCKSRIDVLSPQGVWDLKNYPSTGTEDELGRFMYTQKYHWQLAHGRSGIKHITGDMLPTGIIFVEDDIPCFSLAADVDEAALELAEQDLEPIMRLYVECQSTGKWPLYIRERTNISLPAWAFERK